MTNFSCVNKSWQVWAMRLMWRLVLGRMHSIQHQHTQATTAIQQHVGPCVFGFRCFSYFAMRKFRFCDAKFPILRRRISNFEARIFQFCDRICFMKKNRRLLRFCDTKLSIFVNKNSPVSHKDTPTRSYASKWHSSLLHLYMLHFPRLKCT